MINYVLHNIHNHNTHNRTIKNTAASLTDPAIIGVVVAEQ